MRSRVFRVPTIPLLAIILATAWACAGPRAFVKEELGHGYFGLFPGYGKGAVVDSLGVANRTAATLQLLHKASQANVELALAEIDTLNGAADRTMTYKDIGRYSIEKLKRFKHVKTGTTEVGYELSIDGRSYSDYPIVANCVLDSDGRPDLSVTYAIVAEQVMMMVDLITHDQIFQYSKDKQPTFHLEVERVLQTLQLYGGEKTRIPASMLQEQVVPRYVWMVQELHLQGEKNNGGARPRRVHLTSL